MLKVPLRQAAPGMKLALSLHHPAKPGRVLLKANYELDESDIQRLRELEIREIWVRYPSLAFVGEYINPAVSELRNELAAALDATFETVANRGDVQLDYDQFKRTISDLVDQLTSQPRAALYINEICAGGKTHIAHAANVCSLSLLMGLKLQSYIVTQRSRLNPRHAMNVVSLGVGAMLHDIGMLRLDSAVVERWARSGDESDEAWRDHVRLGYETVRDTVGPSAASVVLNHHQRWDGTGFPARAEADGEERAQCGDQIPVFARIVAAADLYDRLRNPPDGSESRPPAAALHAMRTTDLAGRIDPMIYRALISVAPPYPPGVIVELSDGATGVVTGWSPAEPFRPAVRLIPDPTAQFGSERIEAETVDLRERRDLCVAVADGREVAGFNLEAVDEADFDVDAAQANQWRTSEAESSSFAA